MGFHVDFRWQEGEFLVAFWTVSVILLEDFIWRLKIFAFIQNVIASLALNALRHHQSLPRCLRNTA
jgi:hypothetical protein